MSGGGIFWAARIECGNSETGAPLACSRSNKVASTTAGDTNKGGKNGRYKQGSKVLVSGCQFCRLETMVRILVFVLSETSESFMNRNSIF